MKNGHEPKIALVENEGVPLATALEMAKNIHFEPVIQEGRADRQRSLKPSAWSYQSEIS
ncbi:MAG: hypothetical protein KBF11_03370 [Desulfomicrobium sp.]|nr:hypothetical protein [Desulfomicrobium sp.]